MREIIRRLKEVLLCGKVECYGCRIKIAEVIKTLHSQEICTHEDRIKLSITPHEYYCFDCNTIITKEIEQ